MMDALCLSPAMTDASAGIEGAVDVGVDADVAQVQNTSVRDVAVARTLATIRPLLDDFGIHRVLDVTLAGVPACPIYQVVRDDARSEFFNSGKGYTRDESLVSGLMEAIEVHCFERADPTLLLRSHQLTPSQAASIVPTRWLQPGPAAASAKGLPLRPAAALLRGTSLVAGKPALLPADLAFRDLGDGVLTAASPNGVASGNSAPEAMAHALCEMLERHAVADFNRGLNMAVEWAAPPSAAAHMQRCLRQLREQGIEADLLLISSMAGVAVFICFLSLRGPHQQWLAVQGYGAHLDPTIAMARALAEAVQILALCPVRDADGAAEVDGAERVVMTSKQSALLDPALIARQRQADFAALCRLKQRGAARELHYLFDAPDPPPGHGSESTLRAVVSGMRAEGIEQLYGCVISPPTLPVVVVKCFCPSLGCIDGL